MDANESKAKAADTQAKARENIKALTLISEDIPNLLQSAGSAVALLSNTSSAPSDLSLEQRQTEFKKHVSSYFSTLSDIQAALLKQTSELEEAGILSHKQERQDGKEEMGAFDVAWLNSRSKDVGRKKEKELVAEAKAWLVKEDEKKGSDAMEE